MQHKTKRNKTILGKYVSGELSTEGFTKDGVRPNVPLLRVSTDVNRMMMRGGNIVVATVDRVPKVYPRVSHRDYDNMVYSTGESYFEEVQALLSRVCKPGSRVWRNYLSLHVAKRSQRADGRGDYHVVKNVEPPYAPPSELEWSKKNSNAKIKRYTLAQIFTDSYLHDKYGLSAKFRRDMQLVAITKPADAAATIQDALNSLSPKVHIKVTAGGYAETRIQAAATIGNLADGKPVASAVVDSSVSAGQLYLWGPLGYNKDWFVVGPLRNGVQIEQIHRLATWSGVQEVMFLLSMETQALGIEINDGVHYVSPFIIGHVNTAGHELPGASHPLALEALGPLAHDRMQLLSRNIRPVYGEKSLLASAVQVDWKMLLINDHVKQVDEETRVDDVSLAGGVPVSHDLWMHSIEGSYENWTFRQAVVGEVVAVFFHNGTEPVLSAPFVIDKVTGLHICAAKNGEIVSGMSGGALVALSDFSLLGLHCGTNLRHLLAIAYTSTMHWDLAEIMRDAEHVKQQRQTAADAVVMQLKNRGNHRHFVQSLDRLVALFDGAGGHVGSAVRVGDYCITTCPADRPYSIDAGLVEFTIDNGFVAKCEDPISPAGPLPVVRDPQLHEKVVVVGVGPDGHFMTHETLIRQVGVGARTFSLSATERNVYPLTGGLVMSVQDGAALGMFVRDATNPALGKLSLCVGFPKVTSKPVDVMETLQKAFPMLRPDVWDSAMLSTALRHPSAVQVGGSLLESNQGLALLGDSGIRYKLYQSLFGSDIPAKYWTDYFKELQNNERLAELANELNLAPLLEAQQGLSFKSNAKAYADMMEALLGVILLHEEDETVDNVLAVLGLVPRSKEFKGARAPYGHMMRRVSELALSAEPSSPVGMLTPID